MSDNYHQSNQTIGALDRMMKKYDATGDQMTDFLQRQAEGEKPDPQTFMNFLQKRATMQEALQAQFRLYEKPLKTVLNETK